MSETAVASLAFICMAVTYAVITCRFKRRMDREAKTAVKAQEYEKKLKTAREWFSRPIGKIYIQDRIQRRREGR